MLTRARAAFLLAFLIAEHRAVVFAQIARPLLVARELTRDLGRDGVHVYTLQVGARRFVRGDVDQQSIDVRVSIYDPSGSLVFRNSASGRGTDPFQFSTRVAGEYRIVIASPVGEHGRYSIVVRRDEPIPTAPAERVDQLFSTYDTSSPGGVVLVRRGGKVLFARGYGMADLARRLPNTVDTVFNVASVSKPFTGLAVAQLESQGRLSLEDDVRKHVPELPDFGTAIKVKHLVLRQRTLNFAPGSRYTYSNTNYTLLAEIVRRIAGQSLAVWLEREVFGPAGMPRRRIRSGACRSSRPAGTVGAVQWHVRAG